MNDNRARIVFGIVMTLVVVTIIGVILDLLSVGASCV